jgi:hypothetical protein
MSKKKMLKNELMNNMVVSKVNRKATLRLPIAHKAPAKIGDSESGPVNWN